ncbi:MAG: BolA-like protein [Candidatus Midichloriaceae bacterium]|jgi:stress-induced morphogen|nr:BolA-like protein [Candidatus Midichloriaceae bacterium]
MPVAPEVILALINKSFPKVEVELRDTVGDQDHYEISIKSDLFNGLSKVMQHKMVMVALGDMVGTTLHAISIKTYPTK